MPDAKKLREDEIDRQMKDTFPASDAPSYAGGNHIVGAPKGRESKSPNSASPEVRSAEKALRQRQSKNG